MRTRLKRHAVRKKKLDLKCESESCARRVQVTYTEREKKERGKKERERKREDACYSRDRLLSSCVSLGRVSHSGLHSANCYIWHRLEESQVPSSSSPTASQIPQWVSNSLMVHVGNTFYTKVSRNRWPSISLPQIALINSTIWVKLLKGH